MGFKVASAVDYALPVAHLLDRLAEKGDAELSKSCNRPKLTYYDAMEVPNITIYSMLKRWEKFSYAPTECMILASIFVDRAVAQGVSVTSHSVHRILLSALVLATKWHCDRVAATKHYANIVGISRQELLRLERQFAIDVNWEFHVTAEEFESVAHYLRRAQNQIIRNAKKATVAKKSTPADELSVAPSSSEDGLSETTSAYADSDSDRMEEVKPKTARHNLATPPSCTEFSCWM